MQFSTKGRYALRLMVDLAQHRPGTAIPLKDIAARQDISVKYLEQIVTSLARGGLVVSVRGASGGYRLARPAAAVTAGEVLRVAEGGLAPIACLADGAAGCGRGGACVTLGFWRGMQRVVEQYADGVTLEDLAQSAEGANDYCI